MSFLSLNIYTAQKTQKTLDVYLNERKSYFSPGLLNVINIIFVENCCVFNKLFYN